MDKTSYVIALGSNRRHHRHGAPARVVAVAGELLARHGVRTIASAPVFATAAIGPGGRSFANGAMLIETELLPDELLRLLKSVERDLGRRRGQRWGARVIDLDIVLWSAGAHRSDGLAIPHAAFRERRFVLDPVVRIAGGWRDPQSGLAVRHLHFRLLRPKPVDRHAPFP